MVSSQTQPISLFRLTIYSFVSVFLTLSLFMSIFAPMPFIMGVMSCGKKYGYMAIGISLFLVSVVAGLLIQEFSLTILFAYICFVAFFVCESIFRKMHPVRSLVIGGVSSFIVLYGVWHLSGVSTQEFWVQSIEKISSELNKSKDLILSENKQGIELLSLVSKPNELATRIRYEAPGALFLVLNFILWLNLLVTLRLGKVLGKGFGFTENHLLNFKVKDELIWFFIASIALMIFGEDLGDIRYVHIGRSLSLALGTYYFFQGFGVMSKFLDKVKIFGFFRSFLVVSIIAFAWWLLAIVGVIDFWIQFDKYLNNKGATS